MKKVFKELKEYKFTIFLIFILLFIQAMSNLALPDYMSSIVNVGIQQKGIEESVPKAIRLSEYEKIKIFLNDEELEIFESSYELKNKGDSKYINKFPLIKEEDIYVLKKLSDSEYTNLDSFLTKSVLLQMMGDRPGDNPFFKMDKKLPESMDMTSFLKGLPNQKRIETIENIKTSMDEVPEMYLKQGAIRYVQEEYKQLGIDVDNQQLSYIKKVGLIMLLVALLAMITSIIVSLLAAKVAAGFASNLRDQVFKKVTKFSNEEFNTFSTASLITRSTNDIQQVQTFTTMVLRMVFFAPILGIGGIIRALNTNVSMAWIVGLGLLVIILFVGILFLFVTPLFKKSQKVVDKLNLVTRESLTGMLVIRAFNNQKTEEERFDEVNKELTGTHLKISRTMIAMMPGMELLMNGMILLIVWVGAKQIDMSRIQVGDMMAFMQYAMQIIMSFLMLSMVSIILPRAMVSMQRISDLLNTDIKIKDDVDASELEIKKGIVEFKDVTFTYPNADKPAIENINFTANPGEMTAIIGSTGSGKSTIVNLIPRLYDINRGKITIDGQDIKNIKLKSLRNAIGFVPQKALLFSGNIETNIKYGKNNKVEDKKLKEAIDISQSKEFVEAYELGVKNPISQGGSNVSGGQRQRLSIARAIAGNPNIMIFDDSFSALDFKTDKALRNELKNNYNESTIFVIAQRINTIKDADKIIVLDEGKIVGVGSHRELLENCEVYRQIAMSQLSEEELKI